MDAVSMFQTQVEKVSCQVEKVSFKTRGLAGLGGRGNRLNVRKDVCF